MPAGLLGRKLGMTRFYTEDGVNVPVTVIAAGPCHVTQVKTQERDGYSAIQVAYEEVSPGRSTMPMIGHDAAAGVHPKRYHREIRLESDEEASAFEPGQSLDVSIFESIRFIDVRARNKGKGFQGGMKRHGFKGKEASHGVERVHRRPGSIGGHGSNAGGTGAIKKGKRMAGQMGHKMVSARNLDIVRIVPEENLIVLKGTVPGPNRGLVFLRASKRLGRQKATAAKA